MLDGIDVSEPTPDIAGPIEGLWTRLWIDRDEAGIAALVTDPYVRHGADGSRTDRAAEYARQACRTARHIEGTAVDFHHLDHHRDTVHARFTLHGVDLRTGRTIAIACLSHYRLDGDRITESWSLRQTDLSWPG